MKLKIICMIMVYHFVIFDKTLTY